MAKPWHDREFRASYAKAWRAKNPESQKAYSQKYHRKQKDQGIVPSTEERERVLARFRDRKLGVGAHEHLLIEVQSQDNKCAICQQEFKATPHLDHNHSTGQWRGALCNGCNHRVGVLESSPELLEASFQYIAKWKAKE